MALFGSKTEVEVRVEPAELVAGEPVRVVARFGELDKKAQGARIELGYRNTYKEDDTDSDGDTTTRTRKDDVVVASEQVPVERAADGELEAELVVPADAPGSAPEVIEWFVRAVVDRKRGRDADAREPLTVCAPAAGLATWAESAPTADGRCTFALEASTRVVRPGDRISGTLTLTPHEDISARAVRVQLERRRNDPDRNVDTDDSTRVELCTATDLRQGEERSFPFEITVPPAAPPSFRAQYNHQHWYLQGVIDVKRSSDPSIQLEVVVHTA